MRALVIGACLYDVSARPGSAVRPATSNAARIRFGCGGVARNVAENLTRLGCPVTLVSVVGDDPPGAAIEDELSGLDIDVRLLRRGPTGVYVAALSPDGALDRGYCDPGAIESVTAGELLEQAGPLDRYAAAAVDANLSAAALELLTERLREAALPYALEPVSDEKALRVQSALAGCALIKPNQSEAATLTGIDCTTRSGSARAARRLAESGARRVVLSRAGDGFHLLWEDFDDHVEAEPGRIEDAVGGGDALLAAAVAGLLHDLPPRALARLLRRCAALTCASADPVSVAIGPELLKA